MNIQIETDVLTNLIGTQAMTIAQQKRIIERLQQQNAELAARVAELEAR